ncbi:hypothetical protein MLD38_040308 [Melastoma candidum]|uniref:Uncharacterized protein n=1 Tax=Melastoma candidum TaxID=119954 RepID=A0ACB9L674_9MYRT|nr:hypothetical protein MLD38_040308 [Melastoma candidum]
MSDPSHMMNPPAPSLMMVQAPAAVAAAAMMMGQNPQLMAQPQQILTYSHWPQQQQKSGNQPPLGNPNLHFHAPIYPVFGGVGLKNPKQMRNNWKGRKTAANLNDLRKGSVMGSVGYQLPNSGDMQFQNHGNQRKFYPKRKYGGRFAPYAPRNTTSFIIRAKKSGGITSLVSPCPVTPAVLPTPIFSPSREVFGDMAKEEWGVDGYGSMKGLIRLRNNEEEEDHDEDANGSSESDVEEEKDSVLSRLDHETSRFEMVYPNYKFDHHNSLENRFDDHDMLIAQLEEDNLTLRERLFLMESEMEDLRRRLNFLERLNRVNADANEEVVENGSENESEVGSDVHPTYSRNRIADGNGDGDGRIDELTEGTSNTMSGEEKPVADKEKREDGVARAEEGKDEKQEEMQKEVTYREGRTLKPGAMNSPGGGSL